MLSISKLTYLEMKDDNYSAWKWNFENEKR